jgi:hypothetical protein
MSARKPPKELDAIADVVLAYRPKPKSKPAKKRKKMQKRLIAARGAGDDKSNFRKTD